jgi:hypothetical protein
MMRKLGTNAAHHHFGVLPSATPAIRSESQPRGRWFRMSGTRSSSLGVCGMLGTSLIKVSAAILVRSFLLRGGTGSMAMVFLERAARRLVFLDVFLNDERDL